MSLFFNLKKSKEKFSETLDQSSLQAIKNMGTFSKNLLNSKSDFIIPTGTIIAFYGDTVPDGWALCDGTNRTPDLRNKFILGAGSGATYNSSGGKSAQTLTTANLPSHTHNIKGIFFQSDTAVIRSHRNGRRNILSPNVRSPAKALKDTYESAYDFETTAVGTGTAFDIMPPYHVLRYIMKK